MKRLTVFTLALALLASGCRTTEMSYERKSCEPKLLTQKKALTGEFAQRSPNVDDSPGRSQQPVRQPLSIERIAQMSSHPSSSVRQVDFQTPAVKRPERPGQFAPRNTITADAPKVSQQPVRRAASIDRLERLPEIRSSSMRNVAFQPPAEELPERPPDRPEPVQPTRTGPVSSSARPPTLEELEQMALANNPTLVEAQARVNAARGLWLQVGLMPNPVVGYSGQQLGSGGQAEQQGLFLGQEFIRGGKLRLNRAVVQQEIARAEQELAAQHFRVLTDVRLAYYDFLIAVRRGDLSKTMLEYTKTIQTDTQKLLEGGEAKRSDLLRAQIEVRTIEIVMRDAEFQKQAAWKTLIAVLGVPHLEMPSVNEAMRTDARVKLAEAARRAMDQQQELDRILSASPELAAAMANVEAARWTVDRARAEVVPDVDVQTIFQSDNGTNSSNMNLQITLPIPIWNRNQGGIRQAQAQVIEAERFVDRVALRLIQRFEVVYQRYLNAKYQVEQYTKTGDGDEDKGILVKAQESIDLNQRLLRAGEIKNLEMFVAQQVYTQANLAYLDTVRELWASILEIEGLLLKDSFTK